MFHKSSSPLILRTRSMLRFSRIKSPLVILWRSLQKQVVVSSSWMSFITKQRRTDNDGHARKHYLSLSVPWQLMLDLAWIFCGPKPAGRLHFTTWWRLVEGRDCLTSYNCNSPSIVYTFFTVKCLRRVVFTLNYANDINVFCVYFKEGKCFVSLCNISTISFAAEWRGICGTTVSVWTCSLISI